MAFDRLLARSAQARHAHPGSSQAIFDAWMGASRRPRAAMALAGGDPVRAAALGGSGWQQLADGDRMGALRIARAERDDPPMALLEAETMIASGAIVAGLERLGALHRSANAAATVALARRRHALADYPGAQRAARALPLHAGAALIGARAALAEGREQTALAFLDPFLHGVAPLPDSVTAGGLAVLVATAFARLRQHERLQAFASHLLETPDLPEDMLPPVARTAWIADLGSAAWERWDGESPWHAAARLELAIVSGDVALARTLAQRAGPLAGPSATLLTLLSGEFPPTQGADSVLAEGVTVHVWRTHPQRWQPWIDAALGTGAKLAVYDLATNVVPEAADVPQAVLDDGALVELLPPRPAAVRAGGAGVWIERPLGEPSGVGHEWPKEEEQLLARDLPQARTPDGAAVRIVGEEFALRRAREGRPTLVVAPPGDPFWAGPLPGRAWPAMRVLRRDPKDGWKGAARRAIAAAMDMAPELASGSPGAGPRSAERQSTVPPRR